MDLPEIIEKLSPRQGKCLRYIVSTRDQPVTPERLVIHIAWSDLPHTDIQARRAIAALRKFGLVERVGKNQYTSTIKGQEVISIADKEGRWRNAPPPKVTNQYLHRKEQQ